MSCSGEVEDFWAAVLTLLGSLTRPNGTIILRHVGGRHSQEIGIPMLSNSTTSLGKIITLHTLRSKLSQGFFMAEYWKSTVSHGSPARPTLTLFAGLTLPTAKILVQTLQYICEGHQIRAHPA
jgi:hypothetical protein